MDIMEEGMKIVWKKQMANTQGIMSLYDDHPLADAWTTPHEAIRSGYYIDDGSCQVQCQSRISLVQGGMQHPAWIYRIMKGESLPGEFGCQIRKKGYSVAWITLSDKGARGERKDTSGPTIVEVIQEKIALSFSLGVVIPDEPDLLRSTLMDMCLSQGFDFVFTTGGTGVSPRDITPNVTSPLLDLRLEGFERAMTMASMAKTPHGMISRAVAGTLGQSIVVNLPGSPKAVRENMTVLLPALQHTIHKLHGDTSDCGR